MVVSPSLAWAKKYDEKKLVKVQPNFIIENNRGFFAFLRCFGMFPFSYDKRGDLVLKSGSWPVRSTLLVLTFGILFGIYNGYRVFTRVLPMAEDMDDIFIGSMLMVFPAMYMNNIILICESRKIPRYYNAFQTLYVDLMKTTGKQIKANYLRTWFAMLLLWISLAISFMLSNLAQFDRLVKPGGLLRWELFVYLFSPVPITCFIASYLFIWYLFTHLIKQALYILLDDIKTLVWVQIRDLCLGLGSSFGYTYMYICSLMFLVSLPMLYIGAIAIYSGQAAQLLSAFSPLLVITALAEMSQKAISAVGTEFETELTSHLSKVQSPDIKDQLLTLKLTAAGNPPYISIAGFFNLDRGINLPMLSSLVTYFIFIVQNGSNSNLIISTGLNGTNTEM